jgi:hypothetical protein
LDRGNAHFLPGCLAVPDRGNALFPNCAEAASVLKKSVSDWSVAQEKTKTLRH